LPTITGYKLLAGKCHLFTAALWIIVRSIEAVDGHCGYEFSWSPFRLLPFSGGAEFHNYHHTHNVGNYGSFFTFWDDFCGTSRDYIRYKLKKES
jgi:sterol desaturase/sphingolipid hydroxylase (fatty acid hydroxylase superfamily)